MEEREWISVHDKLPAKAGWYKVKTKDGIVSVPLSRTLKGNLTWIVPDITLITHWQPI